MVGNILLAARLRRYSMFVQAKPYSGAVSSHISKHLQPKGELPNQNQVVLALRDPVETSCKQKLWIMKMRIAGGTVNASAHGHGELARV